MKTKLILIFTMMAISLCLLSCSSTPKQVSVDASYKGKEVPIAVGGLLTVTLESNASTGFQWELKEISDETVLKQVDDKYEGASAKSNDAPPTVGAPGKEIWTFKALEKGKSTVSMKYSQPWEGGEKAAETFDLTVVVG